MSYHHLTTFERGRIEELSALGYSNRAISKRIGRHHSSVDRELHRNVSEAGYKAEHAQSAYHTRRKGSRPKGNWSDDLSGTITDKLALTWSPEQIANTVTLGKVSFKTIYNWLYNGKLFAVDVKYLRQKGKRRKAEKRGTFSMGTSISERPKEVKGRETFGHWELDSMVSSRGKSKGCFATFVERKSRLYTAFKTPRQNRSIYASSDYSALQHAAHRRIQKWHNRPWQRVCLLYCYSGAIGLDALFCRCLLFVATWEQRKLQWLAT